MPGRMGSPALKLKIQWLCGDAIAMGPGKADLLDAIVREGSISGAGRAMGMSYRRTWLLVDEMNRCWSSPLVETFPGHGRRGGARVTDEGLAVLDRYRAMQAEALAAASPAFSQIAALLRDTPLAHQREGATAAPPQD